MGTGFLGRTLGAAFDVRGQWECVQLCHRMGDEPVSSLWVIFRHQGGPCCSGCLLQPVSSGGRRSGLLQVTGKSDGDPGPYGRLQPPQCQLEGQDSGILAVQEVSGNFVS